MAHNVVETNTWEAGVVAPDDGDVFTAASVEAGEQDLANRTLYLRTRVPGAAATYSLVVPMQLCPVGTARFVMEDEALLQSDTTDAGTNRVTISGLPTSGTITNVALYVHGMFTAGAHGGLIATPPKFVFGRTVITTGVRTVVDTAVDPFAGTLLASYEVPHTIPGAVIAEALSATRTYDITISGENGANKANNKFAAYAAVITITP
jgi:hypothetical protein